MDDRCVACRRGQRRTRQQVDGAIQVGDIERFSQKSDGAAFRRLELERFRRISRHQNDPALGRVLPDETDEVEPLEAERPRQTNVGDHVRRFQAFDDHLR